MKKKINLSKKLIAKVIDRTQYFYENNTNKFIQKKQKTKREGIKKMNNEKEKIRNKRFERQIKRNKTKWKGSSQQSAVLDNLKKMSKEY